jgi:uncharacterized repeat protein (TIGR03806 family)
VRGALVALALLLAGCGEARVPALLLDASAPLPAQLSELGVLVREARALRPVAGTVYGLGHPLFSDHALKYRTVHLPPRTAARRPAADAGDDVTLAFPVGTLITKTFYYPVGADGVHLGPPRPPASADAPLGTGAVRLIETRVLRHGVDGWEAVSYLWDDAGETARQARAGALVALTADDGRRFDYLVPDANQCAGCHATDHGSRRIAPIGPKPGNLAALVVDGRDQYALWRDRGLVDDAGGATPWPSGGDDAARAYLDVNCAHCHSDVGAADTAGLDLRYSAPVPGRCKSPVAAGRGSGGRSYDVWPGRPDASILVWRMASPDPGVMMPELGRALVHDAGVERIRRWIASMEGDCDEASRGG